MIRLDLSTAIVYQCTAVTLILPNLMASNYAIFLLESRFPRGKLFLHFGNDLIRTRRF